MMENRFISEKLCLMGVGLALVLGAGHGLAEQREARFTSVLGGAAVKDSLTGLIWEQEPDREHDVWSRSNERCTGKTVVRSEHQCQANSHQTQFFRNESVLGHGEPPSFSNSRVADAVSLPKPACLFNSP